MGDMASFPVSTLWVHLLALHSAALLPLAVGLPPVIAIAESVHVMTGRDVWKQVARFWGRLFAIALLAWALGSILLAVLLAGRADGFVVRVVQLPGSMLITINLVVILALGLLLWRRFRDWGHADRVRHLLATWMWVPLSGWVVLAIAVVYGLLDSRSGADLDPGTLQVWIHDLPALLLNPAAQSRFVHLIAACYLIGATFVLSVSAWYLLRDRNARIARRSMTIAASFGLAAALSLAVLGDAAGYAGSPGQQMRIAAIAAEWHTQAAPAAFTAVGIPDARERTTRAAVRVPWLLGIAATHSWRKPVPGITELEAANAARIRSGVAAFTALDTPWADPGHAGPELVGANTDLGYGLLTLRQTRAPTRAGDALIAAAARDTVPNVPLLFWSFRAMVLLGVYCIALFGCAFWLASKRRLGKRWFLRIAAWSLPLPWLAGAFGWIVDTAGRGPWLVDGLMPGAAVFAHRADVVIGIVACVGIAGLFVAGAILLVRKIRLGPDGMQLWPEDPVRDGKY